MENYTGIMLKKVTFVNMVLGLSLTVLAYVLFPKYALMLLLGVMIAIFNFVLNGVITSKLLSTRWHKAFIVLSFLFRTFLVSVVGLLVYKVNKFNVIAYMLGYSTQFISLILYGLSIREE